LYDIEESRDGKFPGVWTEDVGANGGGTGEGRGAGGVEGHGKGDGTLEELVDKDGGGRRVGELWRSDDARVVHHNRKGGILDGKGDEAVCACLSWERYGKKKKKKETDESDLSAAEGIITTHSKNQNVISVFLRVGFPRWTSGSTSACETK